MLEDYLKEQPLFCDFVKKVYKDDKLSHAYLIETNNVRYSLPLALAMAKYLLGNDPTINTLIDEGNYPDLKIVDTSKQIKKEQVLEVQELFSVKPLYGKYLIYIIPDASMLNKSSANTILKFLEEPSDNIVAILLVNNIYNVMDTIISRSQVLSLLPEKLSVEGLVAKLKDKGIDVSSAIDFFVNLEDSKKALVVQDPYMIKDEFKLYLEFGLYLYIDVMHYMLSKKDILLEEYEDQIKKISKINEMHDIINKIDVINSFLLNCKYNVNKDLFIDNFIISFGG